MNGHELDRAELESARHELMSVLAELAWARLNLTGLLAAVTAWSHTQHDVPWWVMAMLVAATLAMLFATAATWAQREDVRKQYEGAPR